MKEITLHVRGTKGLLIQLRREARRRGLKVSELMRAKLEAPDDREAKVREVGNKLIIEVETKKGRDRIQ